MEEARDIWGAFYSALRRTDMNWASYAFFSRLEEADHGDEVHKLAFKLYGGEDDIDPADEIQMTIKK